MIGPIPALLFDHLHLSSLMYGGIGAGKFVGPNGDPCCVVGMCTDPHSRRLFRRSKLSIASNDQAVCTINNRRDTPRNARVSWKDYCRELGIVRGQ